MDSGSTRPSLCQNNSSATRNLTITQDSHTRINLSIREGQNSKIPQLHYLFSSYLHQDWTAEGNSLLEIFENHQELQERSSGIRSEILTLLESKIDDSELDRIFFGKWRSGYEPDEDEGKNWSDALRKIAEICLQYGPSFKEGCSQVLH